MEEGRGRRIFFGSLRAFIDSLLIRATEGVRTKYRYLIRHTIQLSWYYSIHSALKTVLTLLVKAYDSLEQVFLSNRERAKVLRAERRKLTATRTHLTDIGEHKANTALTTSQKKKLKARKLERD